MFTAKAALTREQEKRTKYNNPHNLIPLVLETMGRWGQTATQWMRSIAPRDEDRAPCIITIRCNATAALQRHSAEMIHRAYGTT